MTYSPRFLATGALAFWLATHCAALAEVKMPAIFGDHMVLQQDLPIPVWGTADPGEAVTVTVGANTAKATAGADGKWQAKLDPPAPSAQAVTMTVSGKNTLSFKDVLIGEVWVCSGQSNMEFPLSGSHNAQTVVPEATDPQLRLFHVKNTTAHTPASDVVGKWEICAPDPASKFTAVGYFFGKELRDKLKRPVGLIESNWGGTPAEAWTPLEGFKKDAVLAHYIDRWKQLDAAFEKALADYPALKAANDKAVEAWNEKYGAQWNASNREWGAARDKAIVAKQSPPPRPTPPAPMPPRLEDPNGGPSSPSTLYDGMVAPLEPYAIRGAIWYQGESNAGKAEEYRTLFPRMIKEWRETWGEGDFPFLWVQLAGFQPSDTPDAWPNLRDAQAQTLSLPATGMATAIDIGLPDNIHPMDKLDVGKRLALAAMHVAYGKDLVYSGPMFKAVEKEGNALRVEYEDTGSGLKIGKAPWIGPHASMLPEDKLVGFEVAGADGQWKPADAKIDGQSVVVSSADVPSPVEVRYDWKAYPEGNLYNKEDLPATPFHAKAG